MSSNLLLRLNQHKFTTTTDFENIWRLSNRNWGALCTQSHDTELSVTQNINNHIAWQAQTCTSGQTSLIYFSLYFGKRVANLLSSTMPWGLSASVNSGTWEGAEVCVVIYPFVLVLRLWRPWGPRHSRRVPPAPPVLQHPPSSLGNLVRMSNDLGLTNIWNTSDWGLLSKRNTYECGNYKKEKLNSTSQWLFQ